MGVRSGTAIGTARPAWMCAVAGMALVLLPGCGADGRHDPTGTDVQPMDVAAAGGDQAVQATLVFERIENGVNPVIANYHQTVQICTDAGFPLKPLSKDQVDRLGTRRYEIAADAGHRLARTTAWAWRSPTDQPNGLCLFEFVETVREDYTDAEVMGATDEDGLWQQTPSDPSFLDVAIDAAAEDAQPDVGDWRRNGTARVAGQPCQRWRHANGSELCMWNGGRALGFSAQPGQVGVTSPDNVMLSGLPLMQTPGPEQMGSGRITTLQISVSGGLEPSALQPRTRTAPVR